MRLLNVSTLKLEEFFGSQIPPYAVLSHCWCKEEVTFQDLQKGSEWHQLLGASKIKYASSQCKETVSQHPTEYIWIDTCCIDKPSSAELSEAINSMYSWYEKSEVCYTLLGDVNSSGHNPGYTPWENEISQCRWFTRGWALQELIASKEMLFFNKNWQYLGNKSTLLPLLTSTALNENHKDSARCLGKFS